MDITKYEATAQKCAEKSNYFASLEFYNIAAAFKEAGATITEMAELLRKLAEEAAPAEEGANE